MSTPLVKHIAEEHTYILHYFAVKKTLNLKISATSASLISSGVKAVEEKQLNMEDGATTLFSTILFLLRKFIDFGIIVHVCYCCLLKPNLCSLHNGLVHNSVTSHAAVLQENFLHLKAPAGPPILTCHQAVFHIHPGKPCDVIVVVFRPLNKIDMFLFDTSMRVRPHG